MPIQVQITKWGNSLGLRVPRDIAARVGLTEGLTEGARVDIEASDDGRIIVTRSRRRFTLDELLAGMTADREHVQEDDAPAGEEHI
jgi:antitoxin MazE